MEKTFEAGWVIKQQGCDDYNKQFYESIFSLGNGYMGVRGFDEEEAQRRNYELCTYIAGIFDYFKTGITDMVNTPNFLYTRLKINGTEVDLKNGKTSEFERCLNLRNGTLERSFIWEDEKGNATRITIIRFLSIDNVHNAAVRLKIIPMNYSGPISIETGIDARITNNPINDDQSKNDIDTVDFIHELEKGEANGASYITIETNQTKYKIAEAFCVNIAENGLQIEYIQEKTDKERYAGKEFSFHMSEGKEYCFDKMISVYTSRDTDADIIDCAVKSVLEAGKSGFEAMSGANGEAWARKWDISDIIIEGDEKAQLSIRYNIFQLIQGNAENDPYVSIGARAILHGRYKGCYFWDTEIFMLPFYTFTNPKAARNLLMYRYNTLPGAEENARHQSVEGARYAWMCTIDGKEQCETWDTGCCEIHITADVAYAVNQYYQITDDEEFIRDYGAEIYIKTARYWKSRFSYQQDKDVYNMLFVKGPNEYGGVTENNTFTTIMAINNLKSAMDAIKLLKNKYSDEWIQLKQKITFEESEQEKWQDITDKAVINYDTQRKLYIEDDNFLKLEPLDIERFKTDNTPLYHKISFDRLQRYMVLKQADIILLMSLLPAMFTEEEKKAAWDFYEPITLHDSTLSFGTHALFAARLGLMEKACDYFYKSVRLDLDDIMNNTGKEGIHFAALGVSWQAVVNGFGGVELNGDGININPNLPDTWKKLKINIVYKGSMINMTILQDEIRLCLDGSSNTDKMDLKVRNKDVILVKSRETSVKYK